MGKIIGLTGPAGCGKTTVAGFIRRTVPAAEIRPFAEPLKRIAREEFDWDGQKDDAGRALLQQIGTTGRNYDSDIWVKQWSREPLQEYIICDDVRYDNEAEFISGLGGVVIKIHGRRSYAPPTLFQRIFKRLDGPHRIATHPSERGISPALINYRLDNSPIMAGYWCEYEVLDILRRQSWII